METFIKSTIQALGCSITLIIISKLAESKTLSKKEDNEIIFQFNKTFKIISLIPTIYSLILFLIIITYAIYNNEKSTTILGIIYLIIFFIPSTFLYLFAQNKKFKYIANKKKLNYYNMIGKRKEYAIKDINKEIEKKKTDNTSF